MLKLFRRTAAVAMALVVGASCGEEDLVFPGGPPGPAADIQLTTSNLTVVVGTSAEFGASAVDEAGNRTTTAPTVASCDNSVVSVASGTATDKWATVSNITGAGLGETCLTVSAGGMVDTVEVVTGPAGITVTGPDTVGSGEQVQFELAAVGANGSALTGTTAYDWSSSSVSRFGVDETGLVSGRGTGSATILVRAPGGADATKSIVIAPGAFTGTLSSTNAAGGALITATPNEGAEFDGDSKANVGGFGAFIESTSADALVFAVPVTGTAGSQTLTLSNVGTDQLAWTTPFTVANALADRHSPANTAPDAVTAASVISANGNIYFAQSGSCASGVGGDCDDFFTITAGASDLTITVTLDWDNDTDLDILWCDAGCNNFVGNFDGATGAESEESTVTIPAGATWNLYLNCWDNSGNAVTNARVNIDGL